VQSPTIAAAATTTAVVRCVDGATQVVCSALLPHLCI
jgi:hypothetical protein